MGFSLTIKALSWADDLAGYVLWALTPYLTVVWKLQLTQATAIKNLHEAVSEVLPLFLAFLIDAFTGDYGMLLLSTLAYSCGMTFLTFSTPSHPIGEDSNSYNAIGHKQIILFFSALFLIAIGQSGHTISLESFIQVQTETEANPWDIYGQGLIILIPGIAGLALYYIKSWTIRFGISAIVTVLATIVFCIGSPFYDKSHRPERYILKTCWYYLCMFPTWISIIICGVISSITSSYFVEQASHLNPKIWIIALTIPTLKLFQESVKSSYTEKYTKLKVDWTKKGKGEYAAIFTVGCAMVVSVIGCGIAAIIESKRLDVVRKHGLVDKPEEVVPMSVLWLLPQFYFMAAFDGLAEPSNEDLLSKNTDQSISHRVPLLKKGLMGAGRMASVILVYGVGKVSEKGGTRPSWFQETLNKSRVDNYYWILGSLSSINLVLYILISYFKFFRRRPQQREEGLPLLS